VRTGTDSSHPTLKTSSQPFSPPSSTQPQPTINTSTLCSCNPHKPTWARLRRPRASLPTKNLCSPRLCHCNNHSHPQC
jgi:hypothetical protein